MVLTKDKLTGFFAGLLSATGTLMIVVNFREYLLEVSPVSNQYIIGGVLIVISWFFLKWGTKK